MRIGNINQRIGQTVKFLRGETKQEALAEHLGLDQGAISRKEAGKTAFTIEELYAVADFLECRITDLLPSRDEPEDDWMVGEGSPAAFYNALDANTQPIVREMIKAAHDAAKKREPVHGRKAE